MAKKFKFSLQPVLDKAVAERQKAERALVEARKELVAAEKKLEELRQHVKKTVQQIRTEHDHLVNPKSRPPTAQAYRERDEYIQALHRKREAQEQAVEKERSEVRWAREKAELKQKELNQKIAEISSLEKMREKALADHQKILDRALQNEIDEAGIQRAVRGE